MKCCQLVELTLNCVCLAFIGALYVDQGLESCTTFCHVCFFPRLKVCILPCDIHNLLSVDVKQDKCLNHDGDVMHGKQQD